MKFRTLLRGLVAVLAGVLLLGSHGGTANAQPANMPAWGHARIAQRDGHAVFEVDGKPFFLYGAAFFYERLPRDVWESSMSELSEMGINTLDLYVPWNWHELADGDYDFSGRTSPRRDFDEVLRLAKKFDFKIVLRPGPVVRNEWRNGGYPAWLLERPEYGMPLHDVLEGRYPATATLQNQHSDDAAAQWMRNATHVKYAKRWLERVLTETAPYADRVIAVALDDDQGAYIDNQTYPAPHFKAYIEWLRDTVHGVTGGNELTFINTYQMKVPASSPVWAMGNWYQSDAYSIGTHDEAQLAFSMAQLATRPRQPLFASEFQAGWLQGAGEAYPRKAEASNTSLALTTMIGTGVRGMVNFPAQDTLDPTGWEAPFANFAYAWDAAIKLDGNYSARYWPTARFGGLVRAFGRELAASFPRFDAIIAYAGGDVDPSEAGGATFSSIATATIEAQQACRSAGYACRLVDLSAEPVESGASASPIFVPPYDAATLKAIGPAFSARLERLASADGISVRKIATADDVKLAMRGRRAVVENADDAVFSQSLGKNLDGFLSVTNYTQSDRTYASVFVNTSDGRRVGIPPFVVRAHDAIVSPIDARLAALFPTKPDDPRKPYVPFHVDDLLYFSDCMPTSWTVSDRTLGLWDFSGFRYAVDPDEHPIRACTVSATVAGTRRAIPFNNDGIELASLDDGVPGPLAVDPIAPDPRATPTVAPLALRRGYVLPADLKADISAGRRNGVYPSDPFREGLDSIVYRSSGTQLIVSPNAGARIFSLSGPLSTNWFTTVGAVRDDVAIEGPLSTTDRIAKYTHDFPAGTFNRPYAVSDVGATSARFTYDMPDAFPHGATFDRTIALPPRDEQTGFDMDERVLFTALPAGLAQRAVSVSSFVRNPYDNDDLFLFDPQPTPIVTGETHVISGDAFALGDGQHCFVVAWHAGDVEKAEISERADSEVARLTLNASGRAHIIYRAESVGLTSVAKLLENAVTEAQRLPQVTPTPARIL